MFYLYWIHGNAESFPRTTYAVDLKVLMKAFGSDLTVFQSSLPDRWSSLEDEESVDPSSSKFL